MTIRARNLFIVFILVSTFRIEAQPTLNEKIAQMVMTAFGGKYLPALVKSDLSERNSCGVILMGGNIANPAQVRAMNDTILMLAKTPPLIATDQEGGRVARLGASNGYAATYTALQLGTVFDSEDSTRAQARLMAGWMQQAKFNTNFAPVADVNVNPLSPAIGKLERSFSANTAAVTRHARFFADEFRKKKIVTTLKHFPGHGSAATDSHLGFTDITATWADSELVPYTALFAGSDADMVMIGHLFNERIDSVYPASLSKKTIAGLLRAQLGFQGPVITDELFMQAISQNYSFTETVELAINAGVDILLFGTNARNGKSIVDSVIGVVNTKIAQGKIDVSRINESYERILAIKRKYGIITDEREWAAGNKHFGMSVISYPNPFNGSTVISYMLPGPSDVGITLYNSLGGEVKLLHRGIMTAGKHEFRFDAEGLPSGIYLCRVVTNHAQSTHKMILLR